MTRSWLAPALICALAALVSHAPPAQAGRPLLNPALLHTDPQVPIPPPEGEIEGACGLAVGPGGPLYVSDYYHHALDSFSTGGLFQSQTLLGTPPEGPCGLALDSGGALYANLWDQGVIRIKPSSLLFDPGHATGIAVDPATHFLYVDKRTFIAVYEASGAPVKVGGQPLQIGLGSLGDAYGVAAFAGRVYVPDAAEDSVKVYEPDADPLAPAFSILGFNSLFNAAATVDPTNGHLLVVDDLQPGFEHPSAAVDEYAADGTFLGRLPGTPVHGEPSGIAVDPGSGALYVTSGNDEEANVFVYGTYQAAPAALQPPAVGGPEAGPLATAASAEPPAAAAPDESPLVDSKHRRPHRKKGHRRRHRKMGGRR